MAQTSESKLESDAGTASSLSDVSCLSSVNFRITAREIKAQTAAAALRHFAISHAIEELLRRRVALTYARQDTRAFERVSPVLFVEQLNGG